MFSKARYRLLDQEARKVKDWTDEQLEQYAYTSLSHTNASDRDYARQTACSNEIYRRNQVLQNRAKRKTLKPELLRKECEINAIHLSLPLVAARISVLRNLKKQTELDKITFDPKLQMELDVLSKVRDEKIKDADQINAVKQAEQKKSTEAQMKSQNLQTQTGNLQTELDRLKNVEREREELERMNQLLTESANEDGQRLRETTDKYREAKHDLAQQEIRGQKQKSSLDAELADVKGKLEKEKSQFWFTHPEKAFTLWGGLGRIAIIGGAIISLKAIYDWAFSSNNKKDEQQKQQQAQLQTQLKAYTHR